MSTLAGTWSALGYMWLRGARNRLRSQGSKLRQPRQIAAFLLVGLYLFWLLRVNSNPESSPFTGLAELGIGPSIIGAVLLIVTARWWLMKPDRTALAFSPAEAHMLFPAPVSRRTLVQFKLLRGQIAILLNVLIWVVIFRGDGGTADGWQRGIALWVVFSTFTLHRLGAALVRVNAQQHRAAGWKRSAVPILVFGTMLGTVALLLWQARLTIATAWRLGGSAALQATTKVLDVPLAQVMLWPAKALTAPVFAVGTPDWWLALGPALVVLLLHFLWVQRSETAFEEAALEASQERAKRLEAMSGKKLSTTRSKRGGVARVLPLPTWGHPAIAIAWKNAAAAIRGGGWLRQLLFIGGGYAAVVFGLSALDVPFEAVVAMGVAWGLMLLLLGPAWMRYDLRLDLRDLTMLRTLPLSGRSIVSAEIVGVSLLHAITIGTFLAAPLLPALFDSGLRTELANLVGAPLPVALTLLLLVPSITLLTFTVHNGLALLYPSWVRLGTERRGFEAMGQTMLTTGITAIAAAVALVFPVLVGAATAFIARIWLGSWGVAAGMAAALLVVLAELIPIWLALGGVLDGTEPGDVPGQLA